MQTNAAIGNFLNLLLNNIGWANVGDGTGLLPSGTNGHLYFSLHTAALDNTSNQSTSEAAYTNYARVAIARDPVSPKWTVTSPNAVNVTQITFPTAGSSETELYWGLGTDSSGAGHLLYFGPITSQFFGFTADTTDVISVPGSAFGVNDRVAFFPLWSDFTFPVGITAGTLYYVLAVPSVGKIATKTGDVSVATESVTVAGTSGGTEITISATGAGECCVITPFVINAFDTPAIAAGQAVLLGL